MAAAVQPGVRSFSQMGTRTKVIVMAGTLLGLFTSAMDQTVVGTSMPRIVGDLGGFGLFSWVGTGFMLASTTPLPIVGQATACHPGRAGAGHRHDYARRIRPHRRRISPG